jgi:hypothetical protein
MADLRKLIISASYGVSNEFFRILHNFAATIRHMYFLKCDAISSAISAAFAVE